jgi:hypothetical protein
MVNLGDILMDGNFEEIYEELGFVKPNPRYLLHSNIPKPLHEVNPRSIKGQKWWDEQRHKIYEQQGYCCAACGVYKSETKGSKKWLECHEVYDINYKLGKLFFVKLIALCPYCHSFIHIARLQMLYEKGEISLRGYLSVLTHGKEILEKNNLLLEWERSKRNVNEISVPPWDRWRLVFEGNEYPPKYKSQKIWLEHFGIVMKEKVKSSVFFKNAKISVTRETMPPPLSDFEYSESDIQDAFDFAWQDGLPSD